MSKPALEEIVSLCKRRGFIYQGSEIYGGLAGTWDYGPLGTILKRNIVNEWLKFFVDNRPDMYQVDTTILMNPKVWKASGHIDTFSDPLIECSNCHYRFRADRFPDKPPTGGPGEDKLWYEKWIDNYRGIHGFEDKTAGQKAIKAQTDSFAEKKVACPNCLKLSDFGDPRQFNLMFSTPVGPTWGSFEPTYENTLSGKIESKDKDGTVKETFTIKESKDVNALMAFDKNSKTYLRPETAQGMFTNYKNILDSFSPDLPFGIAQIGRSFRNEISPRDFIFRAREFEIMEFEWFINPKDWEKYFERWRSDMRSWFKILGLPEEKIKEDDLDEEDRAHYSKRTIDFYFDFPHGQDELAGLAYRTDFDLKAHQEHSGKNMEYRPKDGSTPFIPHVIEPTFGLDRHVLAVLANAYSVQDMGVKVDDSNAKVDGDELETRIVLKLPAILAPIKLAVFPLLKNKPELVKKARGVYEMLKKEYGNVMWDDNGNIGKRYRRQDEIGTPRTITIDFQTLEDDTVTIRDRDTTKQERAKIDGLSAKISSN